MGLSNQLIMKFTLKIIFYGTIKEIRREYPMNIGIMGAGAIAQKMAETVSLLDGFTLYAIASEASKKQ